MNDNTNDQNSENFDIYEELDIIFIKQVCDNIIKSLNITEKEKLSITKILVELHAKLCAELETIQLSSVYLNVRAEIQTNKNESEALNALLQQEVENAKKQIETTTKNFDLELKNNTQKINTEIEEKTSQIYKTIDAQKTAFNTETLKLHNEIQEQIYAANKKATEHSVTVLGIFVGIVMVFFGGFTLLENILSNIDSSNPYRLYFTAILLICFLFNSVVLLMYLISHINEKSICGICQYSTDCNNCQRRKHLKDICKIRNRLPYVYWINYFLFLSMCFICVLRLVELETEKTLLDCCIYAINFTIGLSLVMVLVEGIAYCIILFINHCKKRKNK